MACSAASVVPPSTKPKPRERPVSRSVITAADITSPKRAKAPRRPSLEVENERPPTNSFTDMTLLLSSAGSIPPEYISPVCPLQRSSTRAMPPRNDDLHGNAPADSRVALVLVDVINDLEFESADRLLNGTGAMQPEHNRHALAEMARLLDADLTDSTRLAPSRSGVRTPGRAPAARPRSARARPARPAPRSPPPPP